MDLLTNSIDHFKNVRVLVIGDIMLDRFIYGKVERISPEAPVPIFKFSHKKEMLGGAGNVVANLVALGAKAQFLGIIGQDDNGAQLVQKLHEIDAHCHLLKIKDYPTIVKTRLIAGNNHLIRIDQEETLPIFTEFLPKCEQIILQAVKNTDIVLLSDYNKGLLIPEVIKMIVQACQRYHKQVIVDPKGADYSKYNGIDLIKPNLKEFSEATHETYLPTDPQFSDKVKIGARYLFEKFNIKGLVVTLSEYGMLYISADNIENVLQIPTDAKDVFDVSGAGDTSLATLGISIGTGIPAKDALKLANKAAGLVVGKLGTATVSAEELKRSLSLNETNNDGWIQKRKIITLNQAKIIVEKLKAKGKKIGFTNGCFDCCHLGHLKSLMQTKQLCDVLIVALNSDISVKRRKGENRPIQDEKTRGMLLASFEFIDYVIVFEEDTPLHIVEELRPDVVAKEGYTLNQWPEGQLALSYGAKAVILRRLEGYSTTNIIKKMKEERI